MGLRKKLSLWQKIRIKFEYSWMDHDFHFTKIIARPTWFMTHNNEQIERRVAAYNVMIEKNRKKDEERAQGIEEIRRQLLEKQHRDHNES